MEISGLQQNWKERVQPQCSSITPSSLDPGDELEDQNDQVPPKVQAIQKKQQKNHQDGTKTVRRYHSYTTNFCGLQTLTKHFQSGIKLHKVDPKKAIDRKKPQQRTAKPRYNNGHLPFDHFTRDLKIWRGSVIPAIIDWAGTLEDGFGVNAHPDLPEIVQANWDENFPLTKCDDIVLSVVSKFSSSYPNHAYALIPHYYVGELRHPELAQFDW